MLKIKKEKGFTIIEVLIVLAIAGLIMLIVFLAVPALQRNSRNTQRKNDVSSMLSVVSEYVSNHSGQLPTSGAGGTFSAMMNDVNLGYYDTTNVSLASGAQTNIANEDKLVIVTGAKCDSNGVNAITGNSRQYVALYTLEGSAGPICQQS